MLLTLLKQQNFFTKRDAILERSQSLGIQDLWIIVPQGVTFLDPERLHILYSCAGEKINTSTIEREFLEILKKNFSLDSVSLYGKSALEESLVVMPWHAKIDRARLENVIPFQLLSSELSIEKQIRPLEIPSVSVIQARRQKVLDDSKKELAAVSAYLESLEKESPLAAAALLENVVEEASSFSPKRVKYSNSSPSLSSDSSPEERQEGVREVADISFAS